MKALDQLVAVLCDPAGKCCIHGSEADRQIVDGALAALRTELSAPAVQGEPVGMTVSMDVSTGDHDAGHRIFGKVESVQDGTLLAIEESRNFTTPQPAAQTEPAAWEREGLSLTVEAWDRYCANREDDAVAVAFIAVMDENRRRLTTPPSPIGGEVTDDGVTVDAQGVHFGKWCWVSHEKITGENADTLNKGGSGVFGRAYMKWLNARRAATPTKPDARDAENARKYDELIYAVGSKWPNETRHETALRYIQNAENQSHGPAAAIASTKPSEGKP